MKHTASAKKSSSARGTSTKARKSTATDRRFAVCVDNDGYEASLERNKIYVVLADKAAEKDGELRIIDESGDDYLFSAKRFVAIDVPAAVKASLLKAS
jgi:putative heme iron utilization protein